MPGGEGAGSSRGRRGLRLPRRFDKATPAPLRGIEPHELRDFYDHAVQALDIVETYREVATGITETYMTATSNRMSEIMKLLTIIGTIFIPLTCLAGVYGMNFRHLPELDWCLGYPAFWLVSLVTAALMIRWFRRRGWL